MKRARAEILCVGTELLSGKINTHTAWLAGALLEAGLSISRETALIDSREEIRDAAASALGRSEVLIVCGGLGPTFDDLSREGVSDAVSRPLRYHPEIYARIRAKLKRFYRGKKVPAENRRQAFVLEGAQVLDNEHGSAPGQWLRIGEKTVVLLPGPPWELYPIFTKLVPRLRKLYAPGLCVKKTIFHLCGIAESDADERLQPLIRTAGTELDLTILAGHGQVDFHVTARAFSERKAAAILSSAARQVERLVGDYVFGEDADTLESVVGRLLRQKRLTLGAAESCTAGLLSGRVTKVAGSSDYFLGGIVAYANEVKLGRLGVARETLSREGAVSERCAREMAEGAMAAMGASCGISITGIAGPGGGSREKPVGLVYIGLARRNAAARVYRHLFSGDRDQIRERSVSAALTWLYRSLAR